MSHKTPQIWENEFWELASAHFGGRPKQETLEKVAERYYEDEISINAFINGAKWQQERSYSEEEVENIAKDAYAMGRKGILIGVFNKWFEQFKNK